MNARRVAIVLLAALVAAAPAQAQADPQDPGNEPSSKGGGDSADASSGNGTRGNGTDDSVSAQSGSSQDEHGEGHVLEPTLGEDDDGRPCGIFYWSPQNPDRIILDPNSCFIPLIQDLITAG